MFAVNATQARIAVKSNASSSFASKKTQATKRGALQVVAADKRTRPAISEVSGFQKSANDTGSSAVQIALLTKRIEGLTAHLIKNKKDYATQRGLKKLLGQRSRLQNYLSKSNNAEYVKTMTSLGLRIK
uniref:30S ribosomal protein S15 n=1 Tax=Ostreococcus mediterraneus TaxID=1486918 RepID=A0A6U0FFC6_9CHLO